MHEDMEPEILYYLANDKDPMVRREIADNDGTLQADMILAEDPDVEVPEELAHKLGRLLPDISSDQQDKLSKMTLDILDTLARDQISDVRAIVSDEIKHARNVPKNVVRRLAMDAERAVSAPVIEYSPLLSDRDLLEIVALGIESGAMTSVARRKDLPEEVVDAIIESARRRSHPDAFLENKSAKISDKTIDLIAVEAEGHEEWHPPLVDRGNLPVRTVRRIASFVSAALFERLIENNDVEESDVEEMRMEVRKRIDSDELLETEDDTARDKAMVRAEKLHKEGKLDRSVVMKAVDLSDTHFTRYAMSHMSGLPSEIVAKMLGSGSGKAVTSLCWKSGMSMRAAINLQRKVAKVPPNSLLRARGGNEFPLTEDDMEWQLEFYGN